MEQKTKDGPEMGKRQVYVDPLYPAHSGEIRDLKILPSIPHPEPNLNSMAVYLIYQAGLYPLLQRISEMVKVLVG